MSDKERTPHESVADPPGAHRLWRLRVDGPTREARAAAAVPGWCQEEVNAWEVMLLGTPGMIMLITGNLLLILGVVLYLLPERHP